LIEITEDEQSEDEVLRSENLSSESHSELNGSEDFSSDLSEFDSELIVVSESSERYSDSETNDDYSV
jgi:hypothetical protein